MNPRLFLYDDRIAQAWDPFSLTRPVGELLFGAKLLRERAEGFWGARCEGHLCAPGLAGFSEPEAPPAVVDPDETTSDLRLFVLSRFVARDLRPSLPDQPATLFLHGKVVGYVVPPRHPAPTCDLLLEGRPLPGSEPIDLEGLLLGDPWDLMAENSRQLASDIPALFPGYATDEIQGCHILGDGLVSLGRDVEIEPGSVFDVRNGPIRLSDDVVVRAHTRMEGPVYIGPGTTILGGSVSESSIGPVCKVRGEVEASVIVGYSNKAHDGFLGHAVVGRWVNLGAFTTNSDLKNNYGEVRIGSQDGPRPTGLMKVGCFLGDHVKTGIGTLLNTGTIVGAGSNLFGGRLPPAYVPPFSWGTGPSLTEFRLDKFLEVAARAMSRRDVPLDDAMTAMLSRAWHASHRTRKAGG